MLGPKMTALTRALYELRLPGSTPEVRAVFAPNAAANALGPLPPFTAVDAPLLTHSWPVSTNAEPVASAGVWQPLLEAVAQFAHARLQVLTGEHPAGDMSRFNSQAAFAALAQMKSGEWRSFEARLALDWQRSLGADGRPGEWQIASWSTDSLTWTASPRRLFTESLDKAMRGPQNAARLRRSLHYEATVRHYRDGMKNLPHPYFAPISVNQKEGLAIVDINADGFDDIYITVRLGKNMLLVNQKDGTFVEQAAQYKLDLPGHTTCALFADFDNDGDLDAILGRSLLKTTYLENRQGVYFQHPIPPFMPMAVISMAAADYNQDGLLDVYLCTYRPAAPAAASPAGGVAQAREGEFDWPDEFFAPELAREYRRRIAEHRQRVGATVLDQLGPPNVLLINRGGGRLEPAPENQTVGLWRNTLQATWGDYDHDGDPDLFLANDWAHSNLFRNDGPAGFADVSQPAGVTAYGFSMGASWADFDLDGLEDLYVSNIHSAPGIRMTTLISGITPTFIESASGNWLHRQSPAGQFRQVAGPNPPALPVQNAGWSWGGCFADFDNDLYPDLYVVNGYFTAPRELASGLDLESNLWRTMLRTDSKLTRPSFRMNPEWKRTGPPDNLGPAIDARLAGVERRGDKSFVHSLNGQERNRFFANRAGRTFDDLSALSGLDNPADSRGFALLDYDRDGFQDLALVNANQPLFNLYRNEIAAAVPAGHMMAIRFVGGNRTPAAAAQFTNRDGYGARVTLQLGSVQVTRQHRCGEGWSTQNSATMIVGLGPHTNVPTLTIHWPSGKTTTVQNVAAGTLLTAYENPADSPNQTAFTTAAYRPN